MPKLPLTETHTEDSALTENSRSTWRELLRDRAIFSWALYDWANSAFATSVVAGFFPVFFKQYWSAGTDATVSTYHLGMANSIASLTLALLSPILGAIADQASSKKRLLIIFAFLGITATGTLTWVAKGEWLLAALLFVVATLGFNGGNGLYDALLGAVAKPKEYDRVSALGFGLGYLGGGLLFALNAAMTLKPQFFGLKDLAEAVRYSFLSVAVWWALFTIPLALWVREPEHNGIKSGSMQAALAGIRGVLETVRELKRMKNLTLFLFAYFFYIDGVNTIIRMAVDYGLALNFTAQDLMAALLLTQFVAFPAAIAYGQLAYRVGAKLSLQISIVAYSAVTIFAYFLSHVWHFYALAVVIGLFQGGIQALSRSVYASMIPKEKTGEFFGFFNMIGKFSSVMGPFMVGSISAWTGDSRLSVLSLLLLFSLGLAILSFVSLEERSRKIEN